MLEGPFEPVTVPLDTSFRGNTVDLSDSDSRVKRTVTGWMPEQIMVSLSDEHSSVWRHFTKNIRNVLDEAFRFWIQGHEDCYAFLDMVFPQNGCRVKKYRGMGSLEAMTKGSDQQYLGDKEKLKIAQGVVEAVTNKGAVLKFLPYTTQAVKQGFQDLGANYLWSAHELLRSNVLRLEVLFWSGADHR